MYNIAIMRSTKTLSQTNGDVLAWFCKQLQKEAQKRLNERIEAKLNDKTPNNIKVINFHVACDEWLEHYKNHSGSKATTIKEKIRNTNTVKNAIDKEVLINNITHTYLQDIINE